MEGSEQGRQISVRKCSPNIGNPHSSEIHVLNPSSLSATTRVDSYTTTTGFLNKILIKPLHSKDYNLQPNKKNRLASDKTRTKRAQSDCPLSHDRLSGWTTKHQAGRKEGNHLNSNRWLWFIESFLNLSLSYTHLGTHTHTHTHTHTLNLEGCHPQRVMLLC